MVSEQSSRQSPVAGTLSGEQVILEPTDAARDLYARNRFGKTLAGGRVQLNLYEAAYLEERGKIRIADARGKTIPRERLLRVGARAEATFRTKLAVFGDLRGRGYTVKTALKYGADFRVYDRGVVPGEAHAKWIVYPVRESGSHTWFDLAAKNRVAHSTKKRLLVAIVDDEEDVTYLELSWTRP